MKRTMKTPFFLTPLLFPIPLMVLCTLATGLFSGCSMPDSIKEWDRQIKSQPAGVGIQGAALVEALFLVTKKYLASDQQVLQAREEAERIVAQLPEAEKESLKENPLLLVEVKPDQRADPEAKATIIIFDTSANEVVGNNAYDIKPNPRAKKKPQDKKDLVQTELDDFKVQYFGLHNPF